jgi:TonB family protein
MTSEIFRKPIFISSSFHFLFLGIIAFATLFRFQNQISIPKKIEFTVITSDEPKAFSRPIEERKVETKPRAVFGLNKNTLTAEKVSSSEISVVVKQGNTMAKEQDDEKLKPEDQDSLPNPTEEFLVSQMPVLVSEVRIPYPQQAREAGVEGPVVMELLIDADGKVRKVLLISGPGYGLNEAALKAVENFQFKPAKVDDQSVAVKIRYTYRFVLETR